MSFSGQIRQRISDIDIQPESLYWNQSHTRIVNVQRGRPRVLLCGPSGVGKSSLINEILDKAVVSSSVQDAGPGVCCQFH